MPGGPRRLPDRPNLRFLKVEAKRRHASGEFASLNDAQQAIAREHGVASWAGLKQVIARAQDPDSHALRQLRWILQRFRDASEPAWTPPAEPELRAHFDERFLAAVPDLTGELARSSPIMAAELDVELATPFEVQAELAGLAVHLSTEPEPPYRVAGLAAVPTMKPIADERIEAAAPARASGDIPAPTGLTELADRLAAELGMPALAIAGADPAARGQAGPAAWVVSRGWANLDRAEPLRPEHQFAAPGISAVVTATALLRLAAEGRCGLDDPANTRLRAMRLADDEITIRDLLSSASGVNEPEPAELMASTVPDLATLLGPVVACDGQRGVFRPSNTGVGVLGQIIEDITGTPYADAVAELVLAPLGMRASVFPGSTADIPADAVGGYAVNRDVLSPVATALYTIQAAGGMWSTTADIARLGAGWASLLPAGLAREAVTPQLPAPEDGQPPGGILPGLGWLLEVGGDRAAIQTAAIGGALPGANTLLVVRVRDNRALAILASRMMPLTDIDRQARSLWLS